MIQVLLAFGTGAACGAVFSLAGLPIPAPSALAGVAGVAGITLAYMIVQKLTT